MNDEGKILLGTFGAFGGYFMFLGVFPSLRVENTRQDVPESKEYPASTSNGDILNNAILLVTVMLSLPVTSRFRVRSLSAHLTL
jgi:hypothetical protein